ncbi:MAG: CtkA family protein [Eubacteriales bacterium]|nr:CtkA family protein [Eubacteriales bacterium]
MELINFDNCKCSHIDYGGNAGRKEGIIYNGENYLLKYAGNLRDNEMKNISLYYSNSPLCECIGSYIYEQLGIPVHKTFLGIRTIYNKTEIVVACKDFCDRSKAEYISPFHNLKVTFKPEFTDSNGEHTNGGGCDLQEVLLTIKNHHELKLLQNEVLERFWDMFVIDSLIGNGDRNNENWGLIKSFSSKDIRLAPVYDNGNCLTNKWSDDKMKSVLRDKESLKTEAYDGRRCIFTLHNKQINPYHYILNCNDQDCNKAIKKLVPKIINLDLKRILSEFPIISEIQKKFFQVIMEERIKSVLQLALEKIVNMEKTINKNISKNPNKLYKRIL